MPCVADKYIFLIKLYPIAWHDSRTRFNFKGEKVKKFTLTTEL